MQMKRMVCLVIVCCVLLGTVVMPASADVGFIAPDGKFYYFNVTGGSINQTITFSQTG